MHKLIPILILILISVVSVVELKSQEENKPTSKSYIVMGMSAVFPGNINYGEDNFGLDVSYRHRNNFCFINSINVNYINYKSKNDSIRKQNYSVSVGMFNKFKTPNADKILICSGVDFGVIYKEKLYPCLSLNNGFIIKVYKNLNFEVMLKTKHNTCDKFYTEGMLGLTYSF